MKLQLAKQRMQELEKDIEEKEEKFLRSIHEQDWDSSPDAEDESSLTDFESGARWISVICKEKKDESTKISDQVRSLTSSLSSCKGQGESAGNSLRRLLPSLRENLLRASKYTPLTGKTSSSSSFSSHTKKHSLSSSSSSIWPIHLLHERKGENPPHRRDALPDDLSNPFFFKKHKTLSSSSSSLASRSQEYCFIPDEEILVQDSSLVLSVCTEGLRKRREKDIGEEIKVLRREEVKVSELLTGQGGTGRGGAAGGSVCIQGWLLDMKEQSERDHACAFCKREFLLDEEILQMQKEVEMKVQAVPAQIQKLRLRQEEIRDALPQLQEEMHVIQSIEKQSEEVQKTLQVLQTLQQSYSQLKTSLKDAEIQAASASTAHMAALKLLEEAEDIRSLKIHNLQRYRQEVEDLEVDLHRALAYSKDKGPEEDDDEDGSFLPLLPKRRKAENPSKLVDLNEIKLKLQALEEEQTKSYARRDEVQRTLARAAEEKFEAQQATEGLRREREDLLRQKEEIARLQQEIEGYQKDIQRKQADLPEKQMELDRVKREVQNLQKHLREEESQAEVFKRETEEIARELETQKSRFLEISRQIREAERAVYEASQAASKRGEAILQDLREKRVHLTEELSLMKKSKDTQTHACKRGERLHTFLRNRISVYHKKEEIEREREKIRHLEDTLKEELKGKKFQKRRESDQKEDEKQTKKEEDEEEEEQEEEEESVNDRVRRLRSECQRAKEKKARLEGSLQTRVERVKEIQKELKSSAVYRHVEEKYQSALVDAETELMAVKDLDRYHKALDKALMKYHSMKMKSVNATMKELWQTMYTGHDIDYIAIRSDTEEEAQKEISGNLSIFGKKAAGGEDEGGVSLGSSTGAVSAAGQRSYNYRVVLVKGEVELEMRGRCSAGQKVLASIIIRLALAETFCIHCGVLALDEPTTNLDRYNCESLARALAALVEARRGSESFQLILITHDEHFVMQLSRHGLCDKFFKIHKTLNGDSRISSCELQGF